ncbi:MAG: response regulator transcription factor [Lachnospiraceae bacterium]|nr:response regulator transcription factor [Lachnospiraceae bacterium]
MEEKQVILVVDDDREIVRVLGKLLELEGYQVFSAYDGMEALELLSMGKVHLIILDVMMPKLNGLSTLMEIRRRQNIPVIMLSAKTEESDKVLGLSIGADDYVSKPFQTAELMARVRSQLRRYMTLGDVKKQEHADHVLKTGGLSLDLAGKELYVDGEKVRLTATEYRITELLMRNMGQVFSAEEIYARVWNEDAYAVENTVMVHIRRIREKIEIDTKNPKYLKVVWGIGYKMEKI